MFYNYILFNKLNNTTYNGYTVNLKRRIRQHNGELKGGARSTRKNAGTWEFLAIILCEDFDKHQAMSLEFSIRYPTNKKPRPKQYQGPNGRIASLAIVLQNMKFVDFHYKMYIHSDFDTNKLLGENSTWELIPQGEMFDRILHCGSDRN